MPPSNAEIVARCNELAREFYEARGYCVPEGYRFDQSHHPRHVEMWNFAVLAFDYIEGTDVEDALEQLKDYVYPAAQKNHHPLEGTVG